MCPSMAHVKRWRCSSFFIMYAFLPIIRIMASTISRMASASIRSGATTSNGASPLSLSIPGRMTAMISS